MASANLFSRMDLVELLWHDLVLWLEKYPLTLIRDMDNELEMATAQILGSASHQDIINHFMKNIPTFQDQI